MKSLRESLFDKDLIQKDAIDIENIFRDIFEYKVGKNVSEKDWEQTLNVIKLFIIGLKKIKITYNHQIFNIEKNKLYIYINGKSIFILTNDLSNSQKTIFRIVTFFNRIEIEIVHDIDDIKMFANISNFKPIEFGILDDKKIFIYVVNRLLSYSTF